MLQAGRSRDLFPKRSLDFFNLHNPSSRIMALGSTQPITEMSTRNFPGGKGRPGLDKLSAISEPTIYKMWEPRRLTTLWASAACYRDSFKLPFINLKLSVPLKMSVLHRAEIQKEVTLLQCIQN
jgi:hypothetical protein